VSLEYRVIRAIDATAICHGKDGLVCVEIYLEILGLDITAGT
jgi:hypothetical protein